MIVHLIVPTHMVEKNIAVYKQMIAAIHECGGSLARNWIEPAALKPGRIESMERRAQIVEQLEDAIRRADFIIADVSGHASFGVGYQVALALQLEKPTLLLQRKGTDAGVMPAGIRGENVSFRVSSNMTATIKEFLGC